MSTGKERERISVVETKVSILCKKVDSLDGKVEKIVTNELPHLKQELSDEINAINTKVALGNLKLGGVFFIGTLLGSIITAVIVKVLF